MRYAYDETGNQTAITYPDQSSAHYTYDSLGRLTGLTEQDGKITGYTYDAAGNQLSQQYPNGWLECHTYDALGQLLQTWDKAPGQILKTLKFQYCYDAEGNVTYEYRRGTGVSQNRVAATYAYDPLNRLTQTGGQFFLPASSYCYDSLGNLTWEGTSLYSGTDYKYNNLNQQIQKVENGVTTNYTFDKRGNLVKGEQVTGNPWFWLPPVTTVTEAYRYDATNKMVFGANAKGESSAYIYNALGERVGNAYTVTKNAYGYYGFGSPVKPGATNGSAGTATPGYGYPLYGGIPGYGDYGYGFGYGYGIPTYGFGYGYGLPYYGYGMPDYGAASAATPNSGASPYSGFNSGLWGTGWGWGWGMSGAPSYGWGYPGVPGFSWPFSGLSCVPSYSTVEKDYVLDYTDPARNVLVESEAGGFSYRYAYGTKKVSSVVSGSAAAPSPQLPGGTAKMYYHQDHLGSTDMVTDNFYGLVLSYTDYNEWGAPLKTVGAVLGSRKVDTVSFTGYAYDQVLEKYYAKARFYDPKGKRFMEVDPVKGIAGNPQTLAQYTYVVNNPLYWVDVLGLAEEWSVEFRGAAYEAYKVIDLKYIQNGKVNLDELMNIVGKTGAKTSIQRPVPLGSAYTVISVAISTAEEV